MTRGDSWAETPVGQAAIVRRTQGVVGLEPGTSSGWPGLCVWCFHLGGAAPLWASRRFQSQVTGGWGRKPQPALFISSKLHYRVLDPRHAGCEGWRFFPWVNARNPLLPCAGPPFCPPLPVLTGLRSSAWSLLGS